MPEGPTRQTRSRVSLHDAGLGPELKTSVSPSRDRLEIINLFDRPDFDGPNIAFGTRNFGRDRVRLGFARTYQFT